MGDRSGTDFVQVGATRDGLDPYLDQARQRGMRAVLVETPAYLRWRRALGRRPFDVEMAVDQPQDVERVIAALRGHDVAPALLLCGFERYVGSAFAAARRLRVPPWPRVGETFHPLDKLRQREALARQAPHLPQPGIALLDRHGRCDGPELRYPQVVKPVDGGGGLGVLLVDGAEERGRALAAIGALSNYGGGAFGAVVAEEFVKGPEVSIQAVAHDGRAVLVSVCDKITTIERHPGPGGAELVSFREVGHVARHGGLADPELRRLTQAAIDAVGYREGPFHVDAIRGTAGPVFLEMGFRLSGGGLVALVERATGVSWPSVVFQAHLDGRPPRLPAPPAGRRGVAGQVAVTAPAEWDAARALDTARLGVDLRPAPVPAADAPAAADRAALGSDLLRHTGALGRVVVTGDHVDEVRAALESLVRHRLRG
ncbi:ATP-grasp domain-containing protein [Micromonospora purpureochromogenes]|uniref:ATP-grasp domain-containing protein n=1 Tax=Micromonospora purpureochromogenes TaxID=47872 RepID=UPI0033DA5472